jgi:magnesium-transporting ATPase (P-type)
MGDCGEFLKSADTQQVPEVAVFERHNIAFSSTYVSSGSAIGVVFGTGINTEIGGI